MITENFNNITKFHLITIVITTQYLHNKITFRKITFVLPSTALKIKNVKQIILSMYHIHHCPP